MRRIALILMSILLAPVVSCKPDAEAADPGTSAKKDVSGNINLSILIDLSDRIDPGKYPNSTMEYYVRDVGYINSVSNSFLQHVKAKKINQIKDRIQVYFDPPPLNPDINALSKNLKFELTRENVTNELLSKIETAYRNDPIKLYDLAIADHNFVGSDTWKFFQSKVEDYCEEPGYRNVVVILTDGYIYYQNSLMSEGNRTSFLTPGEIKKHALTSTDWNRKFDKLDLGFIKANDDLSHLEILVLGINPQPGNPYEEQIIKAYWTKWFNEMKVGRFEIRTTELPSDVDGIISDFILKKQG